MKIKIYLGFKWKEKYSFLIKLVCISFFSFLNAQNDTVYKQYFLPEISIIEQKWELSSVGQEVFNLDSIKHKIFFNQRVSEWLEMEGLFYIKNYGKGQLNTIAYRGNTANQSQVLWNGVPIQSPFNGTFDFSQIPINSINLSILRGANPALWGAGASSSLLITPNWILPYKFQFQHQIGSFGLNHQSLFLQPSIQNHKIQIQAYRMFANNNFPYINREKWGSPKEILKHAQTQNYGLQLDYKTVWKKNIIELHLWKHQSQNQIPSVMTSDTSAQNQKDSNLRLQFFYQTFLGKIKFSSQQSYLKDELYYEDSIAQIFSNYLSHQWFSDHYFQYSNLQNFFQLQIQNHWIFPEPNSTMVLPKIWKRYSFIGTHQFQTKNQKWKYHFTFRQENIQNQWIIPIFNLSGNWNFISHGYIKASLGNTYRYPSLNDLYWQVGGNPNLKPEKGFQYEAILGYKKSNYQLQLTYYSGKYQDLIIWLPVGSLWSAQNMNQTQSQGLEFFGKTFFHYRNHQWILEFSGFYGHSILKQERFPNDEAYLKQLIYQPKYRWNAQFSWNYKNLFLQYQQIWNSYVFYTTDNSEWLPDFFIGNFVSSYQFYYKKHEISTNLQLKNLWNLEYQVMKNRPMPGRNFLFGIQWKWK